MGSAAVRDGRTWFSDDLGPWHVIVLDGNCGLLGRKCSSGSDQVNVAARATSRRAAPRARSRCSTSRCSAAASTGMTARFDRCGTRCMRAASTSCSTAMTTTTSASAPQDPGRNGGRRARHRGDHRGHRRRRARVVQGAAAELDGQDRRHLRGAGAHAARRRVVIAARRRRRVDPRPGGGNLPLSGRSRRRISAPGRGDGCARPGASAAGRRRCAAGCRAGSRRTRRAPGRTRCRGRGPDRKPRAGDRRIGGVRATHRHGRAGHRGTAGRHGPAVRRGSTAGHRETADRRGSTAGRRPRRAAARVARCSARSAGVERSRIGSGRMLRLGSKPAIVSVGIGRRRRAWMSWTQRPLVDADERDRLAVLAGTARAADPVHVVLGHHRQLVVHDVRQLLDVEPASRDVGRDEDGDAPGLEVAEGAHALALALVAVDRGGADAVLGELLGEAVRAVLGPREHQRLVDPAGRDEVREQLALALAVDRDDDLLDELGRRVPRRDLDARRLVEQARGEATGRRRRTWPRTAGSAGAGGSRSMILRMSRMKPMSSMRSASSRTRISTRDRSMVRCVTWSSRRPGVATTISGPARSFATWGSKPTPP